MTLGRGNECVVRGDHPHEGKTGIDLPTLSQQHRSEKVKNVQVR